MPLLERTAAADIEAAARDAGAVRAALGGFFNVARLWRLTEYEQCRLLGGIAPTTLYAWKASGARALATDVMERISYVVGIHLALRRLFAGAPGRVAERVRQPLDGLPTEGRSVVDFIVGGRLIALHAMRMALEAEAGGSEAPALAAPTYR